MFDFGEDGKLSKNDVINIIIHIGECSHKLPSLHNTFEMFLRL